MREGRGKIDIRVKSKRPPDQRKPGSPTDHVAMLLDDDTPTAMIDVLLFDMSTEPSSTDPSGFVPIAEFDDNEVIECDENYTTSGWIQHNITAHIVQNQRISDMSDEDQALFWTEQYSGNGPGGMGGVVNRRKLERVKREDVQTNDGVLPIGTMKPNIRVALLDNDGNELSAADLKSVFAGTSDAVFAEPGDWPDILGYRWFGYQNIGHIRVEEKTSKGMYVVGDCQYHNNGAGFGSLFVYEAYPVGGSEVLKYQIEGINWHCFDTSNKTDFKVTETCDFNANAINVPAVTMNSITKRLRVFMRPRDWWGMARYSGASPSRADTCYGIWTLPPKEFMMPRPRKAGNWQGSHFMEQTPAYGDIMMFMPFGGGSYMGRLDSANALSTINLPGDDEDTNGFWIFQKYSNNDPMYQYMTTPIISGDRTIGWRFACPDLPYYWLSMSYFNTWIQYPDTTIRRSTIQTTVTNASVFYPFLYVSNGWFGSAPDGKIPTMVKSHTFAPSSSYWYPASTVGNPNPFTPETIATRTYQYHDRADGTAYPAAEVTKMQDLRAHFLSRTFMGEQESDPNSFLFGCAEAKIGDLIAVIESNDKLLYVWRKTDERLAYSGPGIGQAMFMGGQTQEYNDLPVGSKYMDYEVFHFGYSGSGRQGIPCVDFATICGDDAMGNELLNHFGHIELEGASALSPRPDTGIVPRMLRFGSWVKVDEDYRVPCVLEPGVVDLSPGVRPLYYEQNDELDFFAKRVQNFEYRV